MVKYSEKLFLSLFEGLKKVGTIPDVCVCGSDLIAQEVLETLYKYKISMHVICDQELSAKSIWLTTHDNLSMFPTGGQN
jgi:hypothetical protein